jgi:hypothetical protein
VSAAILKSILLLGRYAVLPVVAAAAALFIGWLLVLDTYPGTALLTLPVIFVIVGPAIAVAVGLLVLPGRRKADPGVDEKAAPGLWAMWNEFERSLPRSGRTLLIDAELNASISERRPYGGLFGRHVTMTVGLELLMLLDERAIRGVVAHEVAHARLRHTSGSANLYDFIAATENILHYADPETTVTGRLAFFMLDAILVWLNREHERLSRQDELAADRAAALSVGRQEMARGRVLAAAGAARIRELILAPLDTELIGAIRAPKPPLQRIAEQMDVIRSPAGMAAAAAACMQEEDKGLSHPNLRGWLLNLGLDDVPEIDLPHTSALEAVLSPSTVKELRARFDGEWCRSVNQRVGIY